MLQNDSKKKYPTQQNQPSNEQSPVMGVTKGQAGLSLLQFRNAGKGPRKEPTGTCFPAGCELFKTHRVVKLGCQQVQHNASTAKGIRSKAPGDNLRGQRPQN